MDIASRVENVSWARFAADAVMDRHGRDVALVVAKVAYKVSAEGQVRLAFTSVRLGDVGDAVGALRYPSDLAADDKPGTDVGLVGTAHPQAPRKGQNSALAWVSMGPLLKVVTVFGPRTYAAKGWRSTVAPSEPGPLVDPVPLRFDQAYGGADPVTGVTEEHNPLGTGFAEDPVRLIGLPAPRLEPVPHPQRPAPHPAHGAFAPIAPGWKPRRPFLGTYDEAWSKKRAPVKPRDFDVRYNSWSVPELYSPTPLAGDEVIEVGGVLPEGLWRFQLPTYAVSFESRVNGRDAVLPTHLDGIVIDADLRGVELTWRAAFPLPRKWEQVDRIRVLGVGDIPEEVIAASQRSA